MLSLTIPISGMSCGGCVSNVRVALTNIRGVGDAEVKVGEATVSYDPELTTPGALREAITAAGYAVAA